MIHGNKKIRVQVCGQVVECPTCAKVCESPLRVQILNWTELSECIIQRWCTFLFGMLDKK